MVKVKFYLLVIFLFPSFMNYTARADNGYREIMEESIAGLSATQKVEDLLIARNNFLRILSVYEDRWLPAYYGAYTGLQFVMADPANETAAGILGESSNLIARLSKSQDADMSEVLTLEGMYYTVLIIRDPAVNGPKYYANVMQAYDNALKINPANPRAIMLRAFFEMQMPTMFRSGRDLSQELHRAKQLYTDQEENWEKPFWGESFLDSLIDQIQ